MPPIPIAIVGLNFGRHIIDGLLKSPATDHFQLAAVCDLDAAKAAEFGARLGVKAYASLDDLLADPDIPVIGLFTGPAGRAPLLRQIIRAGRDVMTTKPFELDPEAARAVLDEARTLGRIIHLNSPAPELSAAHVKIREWIDRHDLGRPVFCRGEATASYREVAAGDWKDDSARCPVAPIFRIGIYLINDLVRLFGEVASVQVQQSRLFTGRPTPDNAQLSLSFANGALGSIFASFCIENGQHYANSLLLHFERGSIHLNVAPQSYGEANHVTRLTLAATHGDKQVHREEWSAPGNSGAYQWDVLRRAISERDTSLSPDNTIVHSIRVIHAMARAERSNRSELVIPRP